MKSFIFAALVGYVAAAAAPSLANQDNENVTDSGNSGEMKVDGTKAATVPAKSLWETETKITTTDFKNNAAVKIDKDVFSWGNFDSTMFSSTFKQVLETMGNDDNIKAMATEVRDKFKKTYIAEEAQLPKVCEAGEVCRTKIRDDLKAEIQVEWTTVVTDISKIVERTIDDSRKIMEAAYKEAFGCEPGCACEFVENRYAYLISTIKEIDTSIQWYESEIAVRKGYITSLDKSCVRLNDEYDPKWAIIATEHTTKVNAIQDWQNDGFELENLVDATAFKAKYGFEYVSNDFDRYFKKDDIVEDRTDLKDYQRDVQDDIDAAAVKAAAAATPVPAGLDGSSA